MIEQSADSFWKNTLKLLILLAIILSIGIFSRAIWYDEAITMQSLAATTYLNPGVGFVSVADLKPFVQGQSTPFGVIEHYVETDVHPPLYFLVAYVGTLIGGTHLESVRFVSLLLTLAAVAVFAVTLRKSGVRHALAISAVFGLSFGLATSAQDARGYAMILLLAVASWHYAVMLPDATSTARRIRGEIIFGLIAAGLLYTHYFAVLLVAAFMAWHLLGGIIRKERAVIIAPLVCTLAFLPWVPILLDHLGVRPDQFNGFQGIVEFLKRSGLHLGGVIISPTYVEFPNVVAKLSRIAILGLAVLGALEIIARKPDGTPFSRLGLSAIVVPALALFVFAGVSIMLDKWFDALRYYLFFAPFVAFLAASGALLIGRGLAAVTDIAWLLWVPISLLVLVQFGMINFGWEANANRGGSSFASMAETVAAIPADESLVIVDTGTGRGNILAAAYSLPTDTTAYLLSPNANDWDTAATEIATSLEGVNQIVLMFTIDRGRFGTDKTALYTTLTTQFDAAGFVRGTPNPSEWESNYYARWTR